MIQTILMQFITLLTRRSARYMTSKVGFLAFVFRYQFFEDFLALIVYIRRDFKTEWNFWAFLVYQSFWTVFRNSGYLEKSIGMLTGAFSQVADRINFLTEGKTKEDIHTADERER